jgi:anionic cell wall polymer biosynthesis LytR-Cps2A-Psr (LCP) family protein
VRGLKFGSAAVGHVGYGATCLVAVFLLVVAGYAHKTVGELDALGAGIGIPGSPSVGAMNILVMGLESRTNFEGQTLSSQQLTETHSGSVNGVNNDGVGAQDTDTLILIHIFAGGDKAVGFSIPRDDVVNFPHATLDGLTEGKIDAAYDYAYNQYVNDNAAKMSSNALYLGANQAGQLFEIQTVESVTGVHIDHFVESNIIGFYYLAEQFGGMEVCIKPAPASIEPDGFGTRGNLVDLPYPGAPFVKSNSGFNAYADGYNRKKGGTQYLHLSPAQSLAYVRSRDTLPGVDIGRTARQQAAIDYVIWKLKGEGVLSDLSAITTMLTTAQDYLITDSGWDLPDFATDMSALTGKNLSFATLASAPANNVPVPGYPSAQSVNFIDVPAIQRDVGEAFHGSAATPAASSVTVDVYNGSGAPGLAGQASQALAALGYRAGKAANSSAQSQAVTADNQVFYGAGTELNAESIADKLGTTAAPLSSLPAGHVEVLLGSTVTALPAGLLTYGASTVTGQDYSTAAAADGLSPAVPSSAATAGTQSVSAAILGARASGAGAAANKPAPKSSASSAGPESGSVAVGPDAPYGIPCVY